MFMTCKHKPGDINCSSYDPYKYQPPTPEPPKTPDSQKFEIEDVYDTINNYIILKVKYPNCSMCSYEGNKVIVYSGIQLKDVLKWREIDPHFRDSDSNDAKKAPSPIARFPASSEGWANAVAFVNRLHQRDLNSNKR
jgi:hypothetical protein